MSQEDQDIEVTRPVDKIPTLSQTKAQPKLIRVLTVLAYILSVSMAAILLSIYYIFIWKGNNSQAMPLQGVECGSYWQEQQKIAANGVNQTRRTEENTTVEVEDGSGTMEDLLRSVDYVADTTEGYRENATSFGNHEHISATIVTAITEWVHVIN